MGSGINYDTPITYVNSVLKKRMGHVMIGYVVAMVITLICIVIGIVTEGPHVKNSLIAACVFVSITLGFSLIAVGVGMVQQKIAVKLTKWKLSGYNPEILDSLIRNSSGDEQKELLKAKHPTEDSKAIDKRVEEGRFN